MIKTKNIITGFTAHNTPEGMRVTYSYSTVDEFGNLVKSNQRGTCIVLENEISESIRMINEWVLNRLEKIE